MSDAPRDSLYYLTTPIYYASDVPHIGHAYTTIVGDAVTRYERLRRGKDQVYFLTGTDEHGEKIERAAAQAGITPQVFTDRIAAEYLAAWRELNIAHDDFIRTTEPRHEQIVQDLWRRLVERDEIYLGHYEGLYCVACEAFYLEKDLLPGNICPDHKRKVELLREDSYFFRLSKYQQPLLDLFARQPDFIEPRRRMNEVRAFVEGGLKDLSVSRTSFRWGVPVPGAENHVIYVWIDALSNYYSALQGQERTRAFWGSHERPLAIHLIGKEIIRFHAVYWPALLLAAGLPLPKKIVAHGWWTVDGEKMSKSLGNVVDPRKLGADIGIDAVRYFVLREIPLGEDGDFSYDALLQRYNSELANDLGNLLNRTLAMVEKFSEGVARRWPAEASDEVRGTRLAEAAQRRRSELEAAMAEPQPQRALEALFALVREGNTYLEQQAPFTRVKTDPQGAAYILYNVLELLRWLGLMLEPFLPERAVELRRQLGLAQPEAGGWPASWGELPDGTRVQKAQPLFPRLDPDRQKELLEKWRAARRAAEEKIAAQAALAPAATANTPVAPTPPTPVASPAAAPAEISFDDWKKLDLRVAQVVSCERVPKKDKLLKVELDVGPLGRRYVVAGLAQFTTPDELVGKRVIIVANLKPAKIGGILSQGMILAIGEESISGLLTPDRDVLLGAPIR